MNRLFRNIQIGKLYSSNVVAQKAISLLFDEVRYS